MWKWIALAALIAVLIVVNKWQPNLEKADVTKSSHAMDEEKATDEHDHEAEATPPKASIKATMEPGRVIEIKTTKGLIVFTLFEKDCPITTSRIADLVRQGLYDGVKWPRVEGWVIQTAEAKSPVPGIGLELAEGLRNAKGAVGMARTDDVNSNTSVFYILKEPQPSLDMKYTIFGRLLYGMDVAMKIRPTDSIITAKIRPLTDKDRKRLGEVLAMEVERSTN